MRTVSLEFLNSGILSNSQFMGTAISTEDRADTVGRDTPGMPKKSSTRGAVQSDSLKVITAMITDARIPRGMLLVT